MPSWHGYAIMAWLPSCLQHIPANQQRQEWRKCVVNSWAWNLRNT